jgi:cytochrome c peroxidase
MRLNIKFFAFNLVLFTLNALSAENAEERIIKQQIKASGFIPSADLYINPDEKLASLGKVIFESKHLSLNGNIACRTCHLDRFGSTDGIPIAAAVGGLDDGPKRLLSGAKLLPRNTLALWGRGAKGFELFFWDGRVDLTNSKKITQFGKNLPSNDSLVIADHLPVVEIREMLEEDEFVEKNKKESVDNSVKVYAAIVQSLRKFEPDATNGIAKLLKKDPNKLVYTDFARSLAAFIRSEFRLRTTKLEKVMLGNDSFTQDELKGARIFYGKGACSTCHYGPHFSDFKFYTVAFPQLGFGKNGFGMDFGRYNVTFNTKDLYKFRTAPLYNIEKTGPYGHSGSLRSMEEAITAHYDPLSLIDITKMSQFDRFEFSKRLTYNDSTTRVNYLDTNEVSQLVAFLKTLSF